VIDEDGSTYTGALEFAHAPASSSVVEAKGAAVLADKAKLSAASKQAAQPTEGQSASQLFLSA